MKIILKENIENLGFKDEIVTVKDGYGRNFLIPKGKAVIATEAAIKVLEEKLRQQAKKEEKIVADAKNIAKIISGLNIQVKAKVAEGEKKLFGSVTATQFVSALATLGHEVDKRFVKIATIKELGKYEAEVRLHRNVNVMVPFEVIAG